MDYFNNDQAMGIPGIEAAIVRDHDEEPTDQPEPAAQVEPTKPVSMSPPIVHEGALR